MSLPETRQRYNSAEEYFDTVEETMGQFTEDGIALTSFRRLFGENYARDQQICEIELNSGQALNSKIRSKFGNIARDRSKKHQQILGRGENNNELAIRYAAQYMVLVESLGKVGVEASNLILVNYPTPNIEFFNLNRNLKPVEQPVGVIESVLKGDQ